MAFLDVLIAEASSGSLRSLSQVFSVINQQQNSETFWKCQTKFVSLHAIDYVSIKLNSIVFLENIGLSSSTKILQTLNSQNVPVIVIGTRDKLKELHHLMKIGSIGYLILEDLNIDSIMSILLSRQRFDSASTIARIDHIKHLTSALRKSIVTPLSEMIVSLQELPEDSDERGKRIIHCIDLSKAILSRISGMADLMSINESDNIDSVSNVSIVQLVESSCQKIKSLLSDKNHEFVVSYSDNIPEDIIVSRYAIERTLADLLQNSAVFTPPNGAVCLFVEFEDTAELPILTFHVNDSGKGIPEHLLEKVQQPFHTGDKLLSSEHVGAGIGLSLAIETVKLLGGTISIKSKVSRGTSISLSIPVKLPNVETISKQDESHYPVVQLKDTLLVVDDDPVNRRVLQLMLQKYGFSVAIACNGMEAVEAAKNCYYPVIFMDIMMPVMDGITATKAIRKNEEDSDNRAIIIATTAMQTASDLDTYKSCGMDEFLPKPIERVNLTKIILQYCPTI